MLFPVVIRRVVPGASVRCWNYIYTHIVDGVLVLPGRRVEVVVVGGILVDDVMQKGIVVVGGMKLAGVIFGRCFVVQVIVQACSVVAVAGVLLAQAHCPFSCQTRTAMVQCFDGCLSFVSNRKDVLKEKEMKSENG